MEITTSIQESILRCRQKSTSTMMGANELDVARRLSERVGKLLLPQEDDKITCTPKFPQSNVWSGKVGYSQKIKLNKKSIL